MLLPLLEHLSANASIENNMPSINFEGKNADNIKNSLITYNKMAKKIKNKLNILKIWNNIDIHKILYIKNEVISINDVIIDIPINFYLALLIQKDENIINYSYNIEYLENIAKQIFSNQENKENQFSTLVLSKIVLILIDNYENYYGNPSISEEICKNMKDEIKQILDNNDLYQIFDIYNNNIEELYSIIIINLIKNENFEKYDEIKEIIGQIGLKYIDITDNIFDSLVKLFQDEIIMEKFLISEEKDFINISKINFYYLFLKYVFKSSIYIYNFGLFFKTRKFLIDKINSGYNINSLILSEDKNILEKGEYIIKTLLDLDYYIEKLKNNKDNKFDQKGSILSIESESHSIDSCEKNQNDSLVSKKSNENIIKKENLYSENSEKKYLSFYHSKKSNSFFLDSLGSGYFQSIKKINITKSELIFIKEIKAGFIFYDSLNQCLLIYDRNFKKINKVSINGGKFNNIIILEKSKEDFSIIFCFPNKLKLYELKNMQIISTSEDFIDKENEGKINFIYQLKDNLWLICFENKICFVIDLFRNKIIIEKNIPSIISAIKIDEKLVALKSCNLTNENNKIIFFNLSKNELCQFEINGYSILLSNFGLYLVPNLQSLNQNNVLLCACKKYNENEKNGILLINTINLGKKDKENIFFYDTKDFEVYCFCQILNKYYITDFILVGGFDSKRRVGYIKLFKINFDNSLYQNNIEFIQDLNYLKEFESPVNHIIQEKYNLDKMNFLVNCLNRDIYSFSESNIEFSLEMNEEIKSEVTCEISSRNIFN